MTRAAFLLFLFTFFLGTSFLTAQTIPSIPAHAVESAITVDGVLDEEAWQQAQSISDFRQFEPDEGDPASMRTEVRVLYGAGNLYVGAILYDDNPSGIEQTLGRRDEYNRADWFLVSVDSYYNRRNAYTFGVNAANIQFDALRTGGFGGGGPGGGGPTPPGMDPSWDAIWYSDARKTDQGWVVEMQIPYSMLRFPEAESQVWGIHFTRRIPRLGEVSEWPLVPRSERSNLVAQFGRLTDIKDIEPRPNLQIRPYTVAGINSRESVENPGEAAVGTQLDAGGDLKVGLGPNVTLDATINPDFGQVESDPAVLNLTAFETRFDEKRPFFIEGIQIYEFSVAGRGELLYTRRIGSRYPIIGATKLSGRTERGLSFGVLGATAGSDFNPSRNFGVGRLSQQIGEYSEAGGILTGFDGPAADGIGRRQSLTGGLDWDLRFSDNQYGVEGYSAFTHRTWTDSDDNSSTGYSSRLWLRKRQGFLNGFTGVEFVSDRFDPNDLGQLNRNNFITAIARLEYQINKGRPFGPFRRAEVDMFSFQQFSYDEGLNLGMDLNFGSRWTLMNFQQIEFGIRSERIFGGYDLYETRGLGPWARPAEIQFEGEFSTDERRNWQLSPEVGVTFLEDGGTGYNVQIRGFWNIGSRLSLSGNVEGEWEDDVTAWISNETFLREGSTWRIGNRSLPPSELGITEYTTFDDQGYLDQILGTSFSAYYEPVFGRRDTRSLDFTLRSDITFTSKLSLQIYSQLFLARGRYDNFSVMTSPDELEQFPAYPKRSEFTLNSLQSNMVLRWEYRPGSNIYLVWTHGRRLRESLNPLAPYGPSPYERSIGKRVNDTFDIFPENALLLKIDYAFLY